MTVTIAYLLLSLTFVTPTLKVDIGPVRVHGNPVTGQGEVVSLIQGNTRRTLEHFSGGIRRMKVVRRERKPAVFRVVFSKSSDEATAFRDVTFRTPGWFSMDLTAGRTDGNIDTGKETYYLTLYANDRREIQLQVDLDYGTGNIIIQQKQY